MEGRGGQYYLTMGGRDEATDLVLSEVLRGPVVRSSVEAFAPRCSRMLTLLSCAPCWSVPVRSLGEATTKSNILLQSALVSIEIRYNFTQNVCMDYPTRVYKGKDVQMLSSFLWQPTSSVGDITGTRQFTLTLMAKHHILCLTKLKIK